MVVRPTTVAGEPQRHDGYRAIKWVLVGLLGSLAIALCGFAYGLAVAAPGDAWAILGAIIFAGMA